MSITDQKNKSNLNSVACAVPIAGADDSHQESDMLTILRGDSTAWNQLVADKTTPEDVYTASVRYVEEGKLSVIPINGNGKTKSPDWGRLPRKWDDREKRWAARWKPFQVLLASRTQLEDWYYQGGSYGLAVVGGLVSGGTDGCGLEIIDFDTWDLVEQWMDRVNRRKPGLIDRLVRVRSPRPGLHVYYRCSVFGRGQDLAANVESKDGEIVRDSKGIPQTKVLIELKGVGGYCVVPPSPRACHPSRELYRLADGSPDLCHVPIITPDERCVLLDESRSFNSWHSPARVKPTPRRSCVTPLGGVSPGDDFNDRGSWDDLLQEHGWSLKSQHGEEQHWWRPGKGSESCSATVNFDGRNLLHVFTANGDPFEKDRSYSKFGAFALSNHCGDYRAAAAALHDLGYGK